MTNQTWVRGQTWVRDGKHLNIDQIRKYNAEKAKKVAPVAERTEEVVAPEVPLDVGDSQTEAADSAPENTELAELQAKYLEKTGAEVPNRYKNDIEWIKSKLTS